MAKALLNFKVYGNQLTSNYQSVSQILAQALPLVAQAYGEDPSMLQLHICDGQAEGRHLVTDGIFLDGDPILIPTKTHDRNVFKV